MVYLVRVVHVPLAAFRKPLGVGYLHLRARCVPCVLGASRVYAAALGAQGSRAVPGVLPSAGGECSCGMYSSTPSPPHTHNTLAG